MKTNLADFIKNTPEGNTAEAILRSCVHCGFCLATCPTYQILSDELDSPRGRIYLIKNMLEGAPVTQKTQLHLDRCLTCRSCETTCPSGVKYSRLLDIGRNVAEKKVPRSILERLHRWGIRKFLSTPFLFNNALKAGQVINTQFPNLAQNIPKKQNADPWPRAAHSRRMLILDGCVQPAIAPNINAATARVLDKIGIQLVNLKSISCCGAIDHHLSAEEAAITKIKHNIDAWWPHISAGCQAIVITASGCGAMVKDYGHLLKDDPQYAKKSAHISSLCRDLSEIVSAEYDAISPFIQKNKSGKIAFHSPCTLQHGQKVVGVIERMLVQAGFETSTVIDAHLCCGSAGTYSILQPKLSLQLRENKLSALLSDAPHTIATANIGCLTHLQSGTTVPVRHWIELLDDTLTNSSTAVHPTQSY